jgi:hypothetical protein
MLQKMWYFPVALGSEGTQKTQAKYWRNNDNNNNNNIKFLQINSALKKKTSIKENGRFRDGPDI